MPKPKRKLRIVGVTGGRDFDDPVFISRKLDKEHAKKPITHLVQGGAAGVDLLSKSWAIGNKVQTVQCDALWLTYQKAAGPIRNSAMKELLVAAGAAKLYAFPGGKGTEHMVKICRDAGISVKRFKTGSTKK